MREGFKQEALFEASKFTRVRKKKLKMIVKL